MKGFLFRIFKFIFFFFWILTSCETNDTASVEMKKASPFKIIIEDDSLCNGTRNRYILTNTTFEHSYLKSDLTPNDTLMQFAEDIKQTTNLIDISSFNIERLKEKSHIKDPNFMYFTFIKNGKSKTIQMIESNLNEFICKSIDCMNEISVKKYQLNICK